MSDASDTIEVTSELLAGFLDEAPDYLSMLDEGLLFLEARAKDTGIVTLSTPEDEERMTEMFRAAHSFKGLGAAMGFFKIRDLTHLTETLFDQLRMGKRGLDPHAIETLFGVFDRLRELVDELSEPPDEPVQIDDALKTLQQILDSPAGTDAAPAASSGDGATTTPTADTPSGDQLTPLEDPELLQLFIETTSETLDELNQDLLKLEESPDDKEILNEIFRCAHNIKGACGAAGLDGPYHLTHDMETVLDKLRNGQIKLDEQLTNALLSAVDGLRADMEMVRAGRIQEVHKNASAVMFKAWMGDESAAIVANAQAAPAPAAAGPTGDADPDNVIVKVIFPADFGESEIQAYLIHTKLAEVGDVVATDPDIESLDGSSTLEEVTYTVKTSATPDAIKELIASYPVKSIQASRPADSTGGAPEPTEPAKETATPPAQATPTAATKTPKNAGGENPTAPRKGANSDGPQKKAGETIRVDLERLDQLINLGGELVINKARFVQIQSQFESVFTRQNFSYLVDNIAEKLDRLGGGLHDLSDTSADKRAVSELSDSVLQLSHDFETIRTLVRRVHSARGAMNDFGEALHSLNRVSDGIQKRVMETRMVAIGPLFQRFRRAVRDMSKATNKEVNLVLRGEATELDKRMIDELADPLTHMVRNSVDHGIESPDERERLGKPRVAQVTLDAYHRGRHICIEVRDDGRGVDATAVRAKILEKGMATQAQIDQMTEKEIVQYVFKPGFSTAAKVTDLSGRGMGMDIVLTKIDNLNGTVEIDSTPGVGTVVVIKLPLTLAIITALVARIGKGIYAVPLETVAEIITVPKSSIQSIQGSNVIRVRDRVIPIAFFEDMFGTNIPEMLTASRQDESITLIILNNQDETVGLVVDEMIGQDDVVIKSIAENYRNVAGIAGASIMGDGTVSLIIDVAAAMTMFAENEQRAAGSSGTASKTAEKVS